MKKLKITAEGAYVLGQILLALGTALVASANFGVSMVVAPAYILSLKFGFLSFGTAEYLLQAVLLMLMCAALGRFRIQYLFSFVTAVIYGFVLDGAMAVFSLLPADALYLRIIWYAAGIVLSAAGISLLLKSYLPPEVYELIVKELSSKYNKSVAKVKTVYDISSLMVSAVLCLTLLGRLKGIGIGTIICTLVNGVIIGLFTRALDKRTLFAPLFPKLKIFFEK